MRASLVAIALLVACRAPAPPSNTKAPEAGIAIALYAGDDDREGYGVVDDRRWIDVAGSRVLLPNIDPGAELASLVIEPASTALHVGACTRARIDDKRVVPAVTCAVSAPPGRYLVRLLYVTKALGYRAQHDIAMRDVGIARVTSRFAITTPVWQTRAELVVYDGVPGSERPPREVARGRVELDGSVSVLAVPARDVAALLRRVYEGAVITSPDSTDAMWASQSAQAIWVWLELANLRLAPGPIRVHLELAGEGVRDLDVPTPSRRQDDRADAPMRLPLWVDESLRGSRQRIIGYNDGASLTEQYIFGVANTGEDTREVFVEEPLRKATKRRLARAWPRKPTFDSNRLRSRLVIRSGQIERTGYTLTYDF